MQNGIMVEDTHELNVSSNIICWNRGHGIEMNHVIWGTVSANNFIDNGGVAEPQAHGIYMHTDTKSVQVTANAIFNWQGHLPMRCGIYETEDCQYNQISHNNINYYTEEAVVCQGKNSVASNNLSLAEDYPHPGRQPFIKLDRPFQAKPFTPDKVAQFLRETRR
jgi:parallel beta-helix repeat protein